MNKLFLVILLCLTGSITLAQQPERKTVFIITDGIPVDIIHKASTPNLDRIEQEGIFWNHTWEAREEASHRPPPYPQTAMQHLSPEPG